MHKGYFAKHLALFPSLLDNFSHFDNKNKKYIFVERLIILDSNKRIPAPNTLASNSLRFFVSASSTVALGIISGDKKSLRKP